MGILTEPDAYIYKGLDKKKFQEHNNEDGDQWRNVNAEFHGKRQDLADGIKNGFGGRIQKLDNRVGWVRIDPADQSPDNDHPVK
jgi:hypothetical protein